MKIDNELQQLITVASAVRMRSYSPYSRFAVGAAIRTGAGEVFTGTNVENLSFGLTLCAERAAVAAAISGGRRDLEVLALVSDSIEPVVPCGACRQVLAEFNPSLRIVSETLTGVRRIAWLHDLFPAPKRGILDNAAD